jgi:hypothetical protein
VYAARDRANERPASRAMPACYPARQNAKSRKKARRTPGRRSTSVPLRRWVENHLAARPRPLLRDERGVVRRRPTPSDRRGCVSGSGPGRRRSRPRPLDLDSRESGATPMSSAHRASGATLGKPVCHPHPPGQYDARL